ncbi:MAG: hypothetical protein PUA89_11140 [Frisingicoccus sp.]|uniref:hypothetical protein n=1 Tax=Frisingicoccus sp. TaxID=1918627 RepID=UPI0026362569|nr:hypothetical protein [Frisingicoccus sp.]MDD6233252.1 hypothetical protein [Frisingicoccus sp.]
MLYVRIANGDGTISFQSLREKSIYVQCETCGSMVPVDDPINFIAEMADMGIIMDDAYKRCAKCSEEHFSWEEEHCESMTNKL